MSTVVTNPTVCCPTCANFPQCEVCNGGASLMKLSINIQGAPSDSYHCFVCPFAVKAENRRIMWNNLNGSYELEQDYAGSSCFHLDLVGDCEDARGSDAILIEDNENGCCCGEEYGEICLLQQNEIYVTSIQACLECVDNQMRIASVGFTFCRCTRGNSIPPGPWTPWSCEPEPDYPGIDQPFICGLADHTATASPCSGQHMERELLWPPVLEADECNFYFSCDDPTHTPTVSQLKAQLAC